MPQSSEVEVPETIQAPAPARKGIRIQVGFGNLTDQQVTDIKAAEKLKAAPAEDAAAETTEETIETPAAEITTETPDADAEQATEEVAGEQVPAAESGTKAPVDTLAGNAGQAQAQGERIPEEIAAQAQVGKNFLNVWNNDEDFQKAYFRYVKKTGGRLTEKEEAFIAPPAEKPRAQTMSKEEYNQEYYRLLAAGDGEGASQLHYDRFVRPNVEGIRSEQERRVAEENAKRNNEVAQAQMQKWQKDVSDQFAAVAKAYPQYCRLSTEIEKQKTGKELVFLSEEFGRRLAENIEGVSPSKVKLVNAAKVALAEMGRLGKEPPPPKPSGQKTPTQNAAAPSRTAASKEPAKGKIRLRVPVFE